MHRESQLYPHTVKKQIKVNGCRYIRHVMEFIAQRLNQDRYIFI